MPYFKCKYHKLIIIYIADKAIVTNSISPLTATISCKTLTK